MGTRKLSAGVECPTAPVTAQISENEGFPCYRFHMSKCDNVQKEVWTNLIFLTADYILKEGEYSAAKQVNFVTFFIICPT